MRQWLSAEHLPVTGTIAAASPEKLGLAITSQVSPVPRYVQPSGFALGLQAMQEPKPDAVHVPASTEPIVFPSHVPASKPGGPVEVPVDEPVEVVEPIPPLVPLLAPLPVEDVGIADTSKQQPVAAMRGSTSARSNLRFKVVSGYRKGWPLSPPCEGQRPGASAPAQEASSEKACGDAGMWRSKLRFPTSLGQRCALPTSPQARRMKDAGLVFGDHRGADRSYGPPTSGSAAIEAGTDRWRSGAPLHRPGARPMRGSAIAGLRASALSEQAISAAPLLDPPPRFAMGRGEQGRRPPYFGTGATPSTAFRSSSVK